ncbi:MAG TPA: AAA family ATPase [Candidatus Saccharimonadales bacterium]|nr:AAA family ATPase [Candidatus Saccharimonadales bacterium]
MSDFQKSIIPPETIAARLAAAANLSNPGLAKLLVNTPRLRELLWWLQWLSMQPGGLAKAARDLVEQFPSMFGPSILDNDNLSIEDRLAVWNKIPGCSNNLISSEEWKRPHSHPKDENSWNYLLNMAGPYRLSEIESRLVRPFLLEVTPEQFRAPFIDAAKEQLPQRLRDLCEVPGKWIADAPWYCEDLIAVLFEAMDLHAGRAASQLAKTEVVDVIFDCLDFARSEKVLVQIEGDSRFGKTESIKAFAYGHPGDTRLVSTPASNSARDMYKAIAEPLGMQFSFETPTAKLKDRVEYIMRYSGLMLIFDEGQFLLPQCFSAGTLPTRLNWVRTQIIDRKLPVALITTPQALSAALDKFHRKTSYNFEQFTGRIAHTATLPDKLCREDLLAIARFYAPGLSDRSLNLIVSKAQQTNSYIKSVENIIIRARWLASRDHRDAITDEDLEASASTGNPRTDDITAAAPAQSKNPIAVKRGRKTAAPEMSTNVDRATTPAPALEMPARTITPTLQPI